MGNLITTPNIPDPVAQHSAQGHLSLKVTTERNNDAVTIGSNHSGIAAASPVAAPATQEITSPAVTGLLPET